ncbi:epsin homolog lqf isoform 3-T3 [Cochliomyia hominivorax]
MRKHKDDMQVNVAGLRRNIKNLAHNYSDAQVKVREATSNDPWGPSATIMAEIAELTNNVVAFSEIMQMIWKRLNDHGKNWRHVYKALILLEYLIKTGNEKVSQQCKENIFAIQTLREFVYFEEGKDQGTHVREKAKQLVNLLKDDERLKNERIKALKAKERFAQYPSGFGSDGYIDGPTQRDLRDMPPGWQEEPAKPVSELEMVRPQTAGEEELQLQLAMAMSREEAEQEEAKRRSDDVRLQLALSQSEQDFKVQKQHKEEPQSHLLDLLDIQLGATSISSPPLGLAAGGLTNNTTDPWGTPARAASQLSDPWTGTASPPVDPWQPATASRSTPLSSAQMGAVGGLGLSMATNGTNGGEAWGGLRTQSPSVTSGSSTEGWLQTNGNTQNSHHIAGAIGGVGAGAASVDPWLSKQSVAPSSSAPLDPWLTDNTKATTAAVPPQTKPLIDDPWAPKTATAADDDPWKNIENTTAAKKPSPDMDEFDIITNRNKTGDLLTSNDSKTNISNNNALLLDDLDPLSSTNTTTTSNSTGATAKKPLKDPQSFLGENSGLVNLDNLIKPAVPQNTTAGNAAAYNPFSDTVIPPKTNLFQQQQPAVPSINQLKQQSFQMTMNQDPWAPVNNTNVAASQLLSFDSHPRNAPHRPSTLNFNQSNNNNIMLNSSFSGFTATSSSNSINNYNMNHTFNANFPPIIKHSKSDFDAFKSSVFNTEATTNTDLFVKDSFYNFPNSHTVDNLQSESFQEDRNSFLDTSDVFNTQNPKTTSYSSLYPHVEIVNNNQVYARSPPSSPIQQQSSPTLPSYVPYAPLTPITPSTPQDIHNINNNYYNNYNNNNTINNQYYNKPNNNNINNNNTSYMTSIFSSSPSSTTLGNAASTTTKSIGPNYSHALSASLASTPGVTIIPLNSQTSSASNLFNYGFYDSSNDFNNTQYTLENNNNMPWIKPEATASNPFLS